MKSGILHVQYMYKVQYSSNTDVSIYGAVYAYAWIVASA